MGRNVAENRCFRHGNPGNRCGFKISSSQSALSIEQAGAVPLTSPREYLAAHHLPNWYPLLTELTPETRVFPPDADLVAELRALGWGSYFVKDFVKSLKSGRGSVVRDPADARPTFAALRALSEQLRRDRPWLGADLSMGMTDDFEVAVEEGATIVRIGRALFGERDRPHAH